MRETCDDEVDGNSVVCDVHTTLAHHACSKPIWVQGFVCPAVARLAPKSMVPIKRPAGQCNLAQKRTLPRRRPAGSVPGQARSGEPGPAPGGEPGHAHGGEPGKAVPKSKLAPAPDAAKISDMLLARATDIHGPLWRRQLPELTSGAGIGFRIGSSGSIEWFCEEVSCASLGMMQKYFRMLYNRQTQGYSMWQKRLSVYWHLVSNGATARSTTLRLPGLPFHRMLVTDTAPSFPSADMAQSRRIPVAWLVVFRKKLSGNGAWATTKRENQRVLAGPVLHMEAFSMSSRNPPYIVVAHTSLLIGYVTRCCKDRSTCSSQEHAACAGVTQRC